MDTLCYDLINNGPFKKAMRPANMRRRRLSESQVNKINFAFSILDAIGLTDKWVQEFCTQRNVPRNVVDIVRCLGDSTIDARFIDRTLTWAASPYGHAFWSEKNEIFKEMFKKASHEEENPRYISFDQNNLDFFVGIAEPAGRRHRRGEVRYDDIEAI